VLCEKNGEICSNQGVCTLGGNCLCNAGKTGQFCEADLDYTIIDSGKKSVKIDVMKKRLTVKKNKTRSMLYQHIFDNIVQRRN
jgi:hypothetical protein